MKLILDPEEFTHLSERSIYNNNYYMHKTLGYIIFDECHENDEFSSFYLVEDDKKIFLGDSSDGFGISDEIKIDFKFQYT